MTDHTVVGTSVQLAVETTATPADLGTIVEIVPHVQLVMATVQLVLLARVEPASRRVCALVTLLIVRVLRVTVSVQHDLLVMETVHSVLHEMEFVPQDHRAMEIALSAQPEMATALRVHLVMEIARSAQLAMGTAQRVHSVTIADRAMTAAHVTVDALSAQVAPVKAVQARTARPGNSAWTANAIQTALRAQ